MPKKESAKRGYITRPEIEEHLKGIGTTNAKITYLKDILSKKNLLSKRTRINTYRTLASLHEKQKDFVEAGAIYDVNLKSPKHAAELYAKSDEKGAMQQAAYLYEKRGDFYNAAEVEAELRLDNSEILRTLLQRADKSKEQCKKDLINILKSKGCYSQAKKASESSVDEILNIKSGNLEKTLASIITLGVFGAGIFFISPNLTGNAISNLTNQNSNLIGAGLLIVGIIGSYFWFKKR